MTTPVPAALFAGPAPAHRLERAATALTAHGFTAEILDDTAAARTRVKGLIPEGASVFTGASETLRLSGIDADINTSGRYDAVKPRVRAMDRVTRRRRHPAAAGQPRRRCGQRRRAHRNRLPGGRLGQRQPAARLRRRRGPRDLDRRGAEGGTDLPAALRRVEDHCLPLESARAQAAYGRPNAVNHLPFLNAEPHPGRGTVLLLRQAIGF